MHRSLDAMRTALRVLTSINDKQQPDPKDLEGLETFAGPRPTDMGLDEFACDVIQKAIHHRAAARRIVGQRE